MALIKCAECSKEISDKATTCPHCGSPTKFALKNSEEKNNKATQILSIVGIGAFIGAVIGFPLYQALRPPCLESAKDKLSRPESMKVVSWDRETKTLEVSARSFSGFRKRVEFECIGDFALSK